jgi:hypothetical protein
MIWRRIRRWDRRVRLLESIDSAAGVMSMVLHDARTVGAPDIVDAATAITIWRTWRVKVADWIKEDGDPDRVLLNFKLFDAKCDEAGL